MELFPYPYRVGQQDMVKFLRDVSMSGGTAIIESGTGTGKTVSSLSAAVEAAKSTGCKVVYLTRTKSQQKQIVIESAKISEKFPLTCVPLQGRSASSCPMMCDDPELQYGTPEELSKLCSEYKRMEGGVCECKYYANVEKVEILSISEHVRQNHPTQEELDVYCKERELCSYEVTKRILPDADIIVAPYPFVFMPQILHRFADWTGIPLSMMILVIDEAHNLPDYLRDIMTSEYTLRALELAEKEAKEWGDPEVGEALKITDFTGVLEEVIIEARNYLVEDDGILPPYFLQDELMERLGTTSRTISSIAISLVDIGELIADSKRKKKRLPRSYIGSLGRFLQHWYLSDDGFYVRLVEEHDNTRLKVYCMDPREAAYPLKECHSSIHMSGTLEPLEDYAKELGLENAKTHVFRSPFESENLFIGHVENVSTRYEEMSDPENVLLLEELTIELTRCTDRNTAVFFPSYKLMDRFIQDGVSERIGKDIFFEIRGMSSTHLMETIEGFTNTPHSVLFAVTGGRISEGLDFPDKDLEVALVIGIPYPRPTARHKALTRYYELRFGDGFKHASKIPATRRVRQAIGRLIRSEDDVGAAIILDRRAAVLEGIDSVPTERPCVDIKNFFVKREQY
ncbi:MAG TPA: ATP-dependent DNA helicase [Candidatus Methanomethylophilaceae archaeon]|nr:ATP-dependent DNA helicase [Candidatus Methanomethylophilaceae archaeon]